MSYLWIKLDVPDGTVTRIPLGEAVSVVIVDDLKEGIKRKFAPDLDHIAAPKLKIKYGGTEFEADQLLSGILAPAGDARTTPLLVELPPIAGEVAMSTSHQSKSTINMKMNLTR